MILYLQQDMLILLIMARKIYSVWVFCLKIWYSLLKNAQNINIFESNVKFWELENMQFMQNVFSIHRVYLIFSGNMICGIFIQLFYAVVMILNTMLWSIFWEFHSAGSVVGFKVVFCDAVLYHQNILLVMIITTIIIIVIVIMPTTLRCLLSQ